MTERLLSEGHLVAATWLYEDEPTDRASAAESSDLLKWRTDVTDPTSVANAVEEIQSRQGPIDALVHLVGAWSGGKPVQDHSLEDWNKMLELNLTSAFLCCRAVLPGMLERNRGRIVLVSSRVAHEGREGQVGYAASKMGVEILAETIAEETKSHNVIANVIAPSTVDTPANRAAMPDADTRRWVSADDVAASVAFLLSDAAGPLRGARLPVYGGV